MESIGRERARSLKFIQVVFAALGLMSLMAALIVSLRGTDLGLPEHSTYAVALGFLIVGAIDTALLFAWEWIFQNSEA